jgi:uncharacterized protein
VTDTNVIVSALLWVGIPNNILVAAEESHLTLCVSPVLLQELLGVLERPKFSQRLRDLRVSAAELTAGYARLTHVVIPRVCPASSRRMRRTTRCSPVLSPREPNISSAETRTFFG